MQLWRSFPADNRVDSEETIDWVGAYLGSWDSNPIQLHMEVSTVPSPSLVR